jgi:two-component system, OmpR family, response regulator
MPKKICRVLVVEDRKDIQEVLESVFLSEGYRFSVVPNGEEMRRVLDQGDVDIVVIDVVLPGADMGLALADEVAGQGYGVVVVSGHPQHFETASASGHCFLQKPFRVQALLEACERTLRRARKDCELKQKTG